MRPISAGASCVSSVPALEAGRPLLPLPNLRPAASVFSAALQGGLHKIFCGSARSIRQELHSPLCKSYYKKSWQKLPIASTVGVTEFCRRILFGAGMANHIKLGSIIIWKSTSPHISTPNLSFFIDNFTPSF